MKPSTTAPRNRRRVSLPRAGLCLLLCGWFVGTAHRPLWHTDLWGHLAYGRVICKQGHIPAEEPLLPLSSRAAFVDSAWLSQCLGYWVYEWGKVEGLQTLYGATLTLIAAGFLWCMSPRCRSAAWRLLGACLFLWVDWQQLKIIRPQLAGLAAFVLVVGTVESLPGLARRSRRGRTIRPRRTLIRRTSRWLIVPVLFAAWSNLHGSFPAGLLWLGLTWIGRGWDVFRRSRRLRLVWFDRGWRALFWLTVLCAAAVTVNPYHVWIYSAVWSVASHPNVADMIEWQPLSAQMQQVRAAAVALLLLLVVMALSPRRIRGREWLGLLVFGYLAVRTSRVIVWWAPLAGYSLAVHGAAVWRRWRAGREDERPPWPAFVGTMSMKCAGANLHPGWIAALVVLATAVSPLGMQHLTRGERDPRRGLSPDTPVTAAAHLREQPPEGLIFNTFEWGDYLLWAGPPRVQVFVASHVHLIPAAVWQDYLRTIRANAGWDDVLDRYKVGVVVLDRARHAALRHRLVRHREWRVSFEDRQAVVFVRRQGPARR